MWHGTPDMKVRAREVNLVSNKLCQELTCENDKMSTIIAYGIPSLLQTVAINVAASFTEHRLHTDRIPTYSPDQWLQLLSSFIPLH